MVSPDSSRTRFAVDPMALLKREHRMILDRLVMVETAMSDPSTRTGGVKRTNRETLRELLTFFTGPVDVHFKREAMLVDHLRKTSEGKQEEEQYQSFLEEHRALKADAMAVKRRLARKQDREQDTAAATGSGGLRALTAELQALIARYREQIACEERLLFALAEMRLSAEHRRRIGRRMLQV